MRSCPSPKISASTIKGSTVEALARKRPQSISGTTASMAMRWSINVRISDSDRRRAAVANPPARPGLRVFSSIGDSRDGHWCTRSLGLLHAGAVERRQKPALPPVDIFPDDVAQQSPVPGTSFLQSHLETSLNGRSDIAAVIRIDEQGVLELFRRTGEMRQDEHARILGILSGDIFLGNQVHAVAQRRHQAHPRIAVNGGQPGGGI